MDQKIKIYVSGFSEGTSASLDRLTKRSRGFGFAFCESRDHIPYVLSQDGMWLGRQTITVRLSHEHAHINRGFYFQKLQAVLKLPRQVVGIGTFIKPGTIATTRLPQPPNVIDVYEPKKEDMIKDSTVLGKGNLLLETMLLNPHLFACGSIGEIEAMIGNYHLQQRNVQESELLKSRRSAESKLAGYKPNFDVKKIRMCFNTKRRRFVWRIGRIFQFESQFSDIKKVIVDKRHKKIVVSLACPPKLFCFEKEEGRTVSSRNLVRAVDYTPGNLIGRKRVYVFEYYHDIEYEISRIRNHVDVKIAEEKGLVYVPTSTFEKNAEEFKRKLERKFSAETNWHLHCCLSLPVIFDHQLNNDLLETLELEQFDDAHVSCFFADYFGDGVDGYNDDREVEFMNVKENFLAWTKGSRFRRNYFGSDLGDQHVLIKRIEITPTNIYFWPEDLDIGNRVIRNYPEVKECFVRVSFLDEDYDNPNLYYSQRIGKRILDILKNGINVGTYDFQFLAFSNSQLRSQSLWMFSKNPSVSLKDIRRFMGDFSKIEVVSKAAARMGQCFSTTLVAAEVSNLKESDFAIVPDIQRGNFIFTDGCGIIDLEYAKAVSKILKLKTVPSVFQFRFAGCKGVVAVYDIAKLFPRHAGKKLLLRKSHIKFESKHYKFEVIRHSSLNPCHLNRQIISLLSTRRVPDEPFLKYQKKMTDVLNEMTKNRKVALIAVREFSGSSFTCVMLKKMLEAGVSMEEPFIYRCLHSMRDLRLLELRDKTKILIDNAAILLGICDETKTLKYGEVFIQIQHTGKSAVQIKGRIVIGKNPAFHPGDVRTFNAVSVPGLKDKKNCVVFPVLGNRDHPNEMSGSDLDGDVYFCCWNSEFVPKTRNFEAMNYEAPPPKKKIGGVKYKDIQEFFVDAMKNNMLGRIANAHLVHYSFSPKKCLDEACVKLAELHSVAVDFPKTGVPAKMDPDLRPRKYPMFMQKNKGRHRVEKAKNCVIERLFEEIGDISLHDSSKVDFAINPMFKIPGFEKYLQEAKKVQREYVHEMRRILRQFRIKSEAYAFSYSFVRYVRGVRKQNMKQIRVNIKSLIERFEKKFEEGFDEKEKMSDLKRAQKASAWYVASMLSAKKLMKKRKAILSLPFIVYKDLIKIIEIKPN